jgi:hypothetical protein
MADFYSTLAQAVGALDPSTAGTRRQLYDRARSAMISKLEAAMPPFDGADVAAVKIAFEAAVARVEADAVQRSADIAASHEAPPLSPDPGAGGTRKEPRFARSATSTGESWLTDVLERASHETDQAHDFTPRRARGEGA